LDYDDYLLAAKVLVFGKLRFSLKVRLFLNKQQRRDELPGSASIRNKESAMRLGLVLK